MNTFIKNSFLSAIFLFLITSCAKEIIDLNGSVEGVVKDQNTGALISNCQVSLSPGGKSTITGADGLFSFRDLEAGTYTVSFMKAGYEDASRSISVISGETSQLSIAMKAKSAFAASSNKLDFGDLSNTIELYFYNNSDETASFSMSNIPAWASFSHTSGTVSASGNMLVTVTVNRDAVDYGTHTQIVSVSYKGKTSGTLALTLQMQKVKLSAPTVTIGVSAEDITQTGFTIQGEVTATGGAEVTAYGHCWSMTQNPTTDNFKTDNGTTVNIGTFKSSVTELTPGTTYYVRAYATNRYGTAYSQQIAVTTQDVASNKWDGNIAQSFASGSGTSADPYVIETGGQLQLMKDYNDKYFVLGSNIDLDNKNWLPFEFKGNLDGKGCIISNLTIKRGTDKQGLFSSLSGSVNVKNLTIKNVMINAPSNKTIGGLAGYVQIYDDGSISNCHVIMTEQSEIKGGDEIGGMIGYLYRGNVSSCIVEYSGIAADVIKGNKYVGGMIGISGDYSGKITSCQSYANVTGASNVGGIVGGDVGTGQNCIIENSAYKGCITGEKSVGGIIGYVKNFQIVASKADVELSVSKGFGGGIVGEAHPNIQYTGIIACYSSGSIKGNSSLTTIGGLCGGGSGQYFTSLMSYSTISSSFFSFDGIMGLNDSRFPVEKSSYCASIAPTRFKDTNKGDCGDITTFLKECYQSEYDNYWNYKSTWTWSGSINGNQVQVSCPKLSWE